GPPPPAEMDSAARSRGRAALIAAMAKDKPAFQRSSGLGYLGSRLVEMLLPRGENKSPIRLPALSILLVVVATVVLGGGVVAASGNALPGDALYPVKLSVESVQVAAAYGDEAKAQISLQQAAGRLDEIDRANQAGRTDAISTAAADYVQNVANANQHLARAAASGKDVRAEASELNQELARQSQKLAVAEVRAPAGARLALVAAARAARSGINVGGNVAGSPSGATTATTPDVSTPTPDRSATPEPRSTATRGQEGETTDESGQPGHDDKSTPEAALTPRPSAEATETQRAAPSGRDAADGSNADHAKTASNDSSAPVIATRTAPPTHEPDATDKPRPTRASDSGDDSRITRTPTPTEGDQGPPKPSHGPPGQRGSDNSNSSGGDQNGGGD
ncbi:MAG TPA: DUF5667 domain-containing protein, partial [Chloroflexota bacterium]|nr:DUF5667 domain-containing protein [Chloroflexota bacterium]